MTITRLHIYFCVINTIKVIGNRQSLSRVWTLRFRLLLEELLWQTSEIPV